MEERRERSTPSGGKSDGADVLQNNEVVKSPLNTNQNTHLFLGHNFQGTFPLKKTILSTFL